MNGHRTIKLWRGEFLRGSHEDGPYRCPWLHYQGRCRGQSDHRSCHRGQACTEVTGVIFTVDAAGPAPCRTPNAPGLTAAMGDEETAYADAAGRRNPDFVTWALEKPRSGPFSRPLQLDNRRFHIAGCHPLAWAGRRLDFPGCFNPDPSCCDQGEADRRRTCQERLLADRRRGRHWNNSLFRVNNTVPDNDHDENRRIGEWQTVGTDAGCSPEEFRD